MDTAGVHNNKDIYPSYEVCVEKLLFLFRTVKDQKSSSEFLNRGSEVENSFREIP